MNCLRRWLRVLLVTTMISALGGCSDPQVYGSVGVSSGIGSWGGSGTRVHTSISVGGRIR